MKLFKYSLLCAFVLVSSELYAQNSQSINYQQRFKDAIAQLDTCQECAVKQLLEIKAAQYAPEITRINSTIVLANISVNTGNIESLDVFMKDIEQYLAQHPDDKDVSATLERLKDNRSELSKQQETFRDRLVGTWVTAEAYHLRTYPVKGFPFNIIEIKKYDNGEFSATYYYRWDKNWIPAITDNIDIDGAHKAIGIHFGTEKMKKADSEYAQSLMASVQQNAKESAATKARTGHSDWGKDLGNIFLTLMAKNASVSKTTFLLHDYFLKELTPNILFGRYYYEYREDRSDGKYSNPETHVRDIYLYRITPEDSITFVFPHKEGYYACKYNCHFKDFKEYKKQLPKGTKTSEKEVNLEAYAKLRTKIMKHVSDLEESHAEWVTGELEYGPLGYLWNDGYYMAYSVEAKKDTIFYDEKYKGPYLPAKKGVFKVFDNLTTIHDYWKTFNREYDFIESPDWYNIYESGRKLDITYGPIYFKMKSEEDAKKDKKKKGKKEDEE